MTKSAAVTVEVAKIATAVSVEIRYISDALRLIGDAKFIRLDTGAGLGGKTVHMRWTKPDGSVETSTVKTPSSGWVGWVLVPIGQQGHWVFEAWFNGDATFEACSASASYDVPGVPTMLTLKVDFAVELAHIHYVGVLTRADTGEPLEGEEIIIRFTRGDGTTGEKRVTTTKAVDSAYNYIGGWNPVLTPENMGTWTFQAEFPGRGMFMGCDQAEHQIILSCPECKGRIPISNPVQGKPIICTCGAHLQLVRL